MVATTANKALLRRYIEEIWNRGALGELEQLVAADFAWCDPGTRGERRGLSELRTHVITHRKALPNCMSRSRSRSARATA
jgi:SnoaL-like polyketide cyclase